MVGILWFIPLTVAQCVTAHFGEYDVDHVLTYQIHFHISGRPNLKDSTMAFCLQLARAV